MELLRGWLNEELALSRAVGPFEDDLSNGFLLGEVLHLFNQQPDFAQFNDAWSVDAKLRNFCLLEPTIRGLGIRFDSKLALSIIGKEKGHAAKLVYQLKMAILKLGTRAAISTRATKGADHVVPLCNMPMRPAKPTFDAVGANFFEKSLRMALENQNDTLAARALSRFEVEKQHQHDYAVESQKLETQLLGSRKDEMRQYRMHQTKREHEFLQDWQAKGAEEWAVNQKIARERRAVKERCVIKADTERWERATAGRETATDTMRRDIAQFEARNAANAAVLAATAPLAPLTSETYGASAIGGGAPLPPAPVSPSKGAGPETLEELDARLELMQPDARARKREADGHLTAMRGAADLAAGRRGEKRRRRRAFVQQQQEARAAAEERRLLAFLEGSLVKEAAMEVDLEQELGDVRSFAAVAREDRAFRETQHDARRAADVAGAQRRDGAALAAAQALHGAEVGNQLDRYDGLLEARAAAATARATVVCRDLARGIGDLALWLAQQREQRHGAAADLAVAAKQQTLEWTAAEAAAADVVPPAIEWAEEKRLLLAGAAVFPLGHCSAADADRILGPQEMSDYLESQGLWAPEAVEARAVAAAAMVAAPAAPKEEGEDGEAAPAAAEEEKEEEEEVPPPNNGASGAPAAHPALGDVVQQLRLLADPLPPPPPPPPVTQHRLCICLLGRPFVGKSAHAAALAKRFRLAKLETDELLRLALAAAEEGPLQIEDVRTDMRAAKATARARKKFDEIDGNGNGAIEGAEVETLARWVLDSFKPSAGTANMSLPLSRAEIDGMVSKLMKRVDADHNGQMDFAEFSAYYVQTSANIAKFRRARADKAQREKEAEAARQALHAKLEAARAEGGEEGAAEVMEQEAAAQRMQAITRGRAARKAAADDAEQAAAAAKMQMAARGKRDRKKFKSKKEGKPDATARRVNYHNALCAVGEAARAALRRGEAVPDELHAALVAAAATALDPALYGGWVLADFPATKAQAQLLEKALSGYDESAPHPTPADRASAIAPPSPAAPPPPPSSALHLVLELQDGEGDCSAHSVAARGGSNDKGEAAVRRALGRRVDPKTGQLYHVADAPPSPAEVVDGRASDDCPGIRQRLRQVGVSAVTPDEALKPLEDLSFRAAVRDEHQAALAAWLAQFGTLRSFDVGGRAEAQVGAALEAQVAEFTGARATAEAAEKARLKAIRKDARAAEEAAAARDAELVEAVEAAAAALVEAAAAIEEGELAVVEAGKDKAAKKAATEALAPLQEAEAAARALHGEAEAAVTAYREEVKAEAAAEAAKHFTPPKPEPPAALATHLTALWDAAETQFCAATEGNQASLRAERAAAVAHLRDTTGAFGAFVRRPDERQALVEAFQREFNAVEPDMRFGERTKEELHLRTDELVDALWGATERREAEALEELGAVRAEGWLEARRAAVADVYCHQVQCEVDHAHGAQLVLRDAADGCTTRDALPVAEGGEAVAYSGAEGWEKLRAPPAADGEAAAVPKTGAATAEEPALWQPTAPPAVAADLYLDAEAAAAATAEAEAAASAGKGKAAKAAKAGAEDDATDGAAAKPAVDQRARVRGVVAAALAVLAPGADENGVDALAAAAEEANNPKATPAARRASAKALEEAEDAAAAATAAEEGGAQLTPEQVAAAALAAAQAQSRAIGSARVQRLLRACVTALDELDAAAAAAYERMARAVASRAEAEGTAIAALGRVCRAAIESEAPLSHDLRIEQRDTYRFPFLEQLPADTDATLDRGLRVVPAPLPDAPPTVEQLDGAAFSAEQLEALRAALQSAARGGGAGGAAKMTCARFAGVLARLANAYDNALPALWQRRPASALAKVRRRSFPCPPARLAARLPRTCALRSPCSPAASAPPPPPPPRNQQLASFSSGSMDVADFIERVSTPAGAAEVVASFQ
jgi:adenylate kinase family enzyme